MLAHPTLNKLNAMGLSGMAKAFSELVANGEAEHLSHAEWLGLLLEREWSFRCDRKLAARLRFAKLRHQTTPEDIDYRSERGLDRALLMKLLGGDWINAHHNLAIWPSGVGKSWFACALGHKACRDDRSVLYQRVPRLFSQLALAGGGDGRYARLQRTLGHVQLLILDDWGLEPPNEQARHDLLEILEDRYDRRSTIITSQLPVSAWHGVIGDPTYADAILDRLVHNAHRIEISGDSLRRNLSRKA
ncbi:ATP-binding protein (plasmid) [Rhizobium leguminosarum]|uniref:IS21-like element helper ATPase IstB n=1 Tax=Rhizobium leguminosarum TaxID=384 RepID=UPI0010322559|nr:IS21-like element helper ATPase IstB [Rhizobium leguminosarum]TBF24877.1 ATP-binding protein [Rhizobium leguminosarum]